MSAPLLCFSVKLDGLDPLPFSGVAWFGLYLGRFCLFLFDFCIFEMPEASQCYSSAVVKLKHEQELRGTTTEGKKKDLYER